MCKCTKKKEEKMKKFSGGPFLPLFDIGLKPLRFCCIAYRHPLNQWAKLALCKCKN